MSKKLLEESTVRSFMKLANLQPLSEKFITEKYMEETSHDKKDEKKKDEKKHDKEKLKEEELEEGETLEEETLEEDSLEEGEQLDEEVVEEGDELEEGKESEGRPASKKEAPKGTSLAGKPQQGIDGAKSVKSPGKLKPAQKSSHHSDKPDSVEAKSHSNAPKKNNSTFEVVSENLEEMGMSKKPGLPSMEEEMDSPEGEEMAGGAESGPHKDKMKGLIRSMLNTLKDMGSEYGMSMEISDEGASEETPDMGAVETPPESPEAGAEEDEGMMQEKLDEMVEKLTKRVAARLVKESKKKR